jgi:pilus assembly protein CpaF
VHTARLPDGSRKVVHIAEMTGMEGDTFVLQDLYSYKQTGFDAAGHVRGYHTAFGAVPRFVEDVKERGIHVDLGLFTPRKAREAKGS